MNVEPQNGAAHSDSFLDIILVILQLGLGQHHCCINLMIYSQLAMVSSGLIL